MPKQILRLSSKEKRQHQSFQQMPNNNIFALGIMTPVCWKGKMKLCDIVLALQSLQREEVEVDGWICNFYTGDSSLLTVSHK